MKLLRYLNQVYRIVPFREIPREDVPYLILRHDIDASPLTALKMAQIERDLGVRSTYFVLFSSRFYNVLEGKNVSILRQISRLGHEIGLHYDILQYRSYGQNMKQTLEIEIKMLEHLVNRKVYSICRHRPQDGGRDPFVNLKGYINADDPRLRDLFVGEGSRAWRIQSLSKLFDDPPPRRVLLLIHPHWWQEEKCDRYALLERLFKELEKENLAHLKQIKQTWRTIPVVTEYDALIKEGKFTQIPRQRHKSSSTKQGVSQQLLKYYDTTLSWHLCNTRLGWYLHKLKMNIHHRLKQRRAC